MQPKKTVGGLANNGAVPRTNMSPYQGSYAQTQTQPVSGVLKTPVNKSYPQQGTNPGFVPTTPKPSTPVKKVTRPDGTTVEYHAPEKTGNTGTSTKTTSGVLPTQASNVKQGQTFTDTSGNQGVAQFDPMTGKAYPTPTPTPTPAPLTVAGQAPGVLGTGPQTTNESQTQGRLNELANNPIAGFTEKQARIDKINEQITALKSQYAGQVGAIGGQGADLAFKTGEGASIRDAYNQNLIALTDQLNAETGQLGALNTQQGLQTTAGQGAYSGSQNQAQRATGVAENVLGAVAPTGNIINVSPVTGLPIAGGSLNNLAQTAGTINGIQTGAAAQAAAGGQTAAQNIITGGTAAVNAGAAAYAQNNPAYAKLAYETVPNIEGFGNLLMQGAGGINPFDSQHANMTVSAFQNELSDPQRAQFNTTAQQLNKSIGELAGAGGSQTPTQNVIQADGTFNPNMKLSTLKDVLSRIAQEGTQYLTTKANLSNANLYQAQGGGNNTNNETVSAGGFNFKLVNGKYVPA